MENGINVKMKKGFTLAEVLITLTIIGIIAAMTLPTLMNSTNSGEYTSGLKKAIATLNQGLTKQYAIDGVDASNYKNSAIGLRDNIFVKSLNVINTANNTAFSTGKATSSQIFYTADGMKFGIATAYNGGSDCDANGLNPCFDIIIDVNGDKNPNTPTTSTSKPRDEYYATVYSQKVVPYGAVTQGVIFNQ